LASVSVGSPPVCILQVGDPARCALAQGARGRIADAGAVASAPASIVPLHGYSAFRKNLQEDFEEHQYIKLPETKSHNNHAGCGAMQILASRRKISYCRVSIEVDLTRRSSARRLPISGGADGNARAIRTSRFGRLSCLAARSGLARIGSGTSCWTASRRNTFFGQPLQAGGSRLNFRDECRQPSKPAARWMPRRLTALVRDGSFIHNFMNGCQRCSGDGAERPLPPSANWRCRP